MTTCPRCGCEFEYDDGEYDDGEYYEPEPPEPEYPCTAYIRGVVLSSEDAGMDPGTWRVGRLNDVCTPRGRRFTLSGHPVFGVAWRHPAGAVACQWGIWDRAPYPHAVTPTRNSDALLHAQNGNACHCVVGDAWHASCT